MRVNNTRAGYKYFVRFAGKGPDREGIAGGDIVYRRDKNGINCAGMGPYIYR
jgi:hypothetical protein